MASKAKNRPERQDDSVRGELSRRFKANPFLFIGTIVILVIVIVAFVLVPALPGTQGGGGDLTFGTYNRTPISYVPGNYFYQVQQNLAQQQQSSLTESNYQYTLYQIWREAFETTAARIGMIDEVKAAGYTPPEDVVDRQVALLDEFQENGRFSAAKYRKLDNNARITLWRQVQENISAQRYYSDLTGLKASARETAFVTAMAYPQRSFDLAAFPLSSYPDSEVAAYVAANPDRFTVTHLSRVTVGSSERETRQILNKVKEGALAFEEAARSNSIDSYADNGGDMGIRMAYEFQAEIPDEASRQAVLTLEKGEFSGIVAVSGGSWAFFRAEEAPRPADTADSAALGKIRTYIMGYERGTVEDWVTSEAEKFAETAKEKGFASALAGKSMAKKTFGPLPVNYGDVVLFPSVSSLGVGEISQAGYNENFWNAAFSTPLGSPSDPVVLGDNVLVLCPTEEKAAPDDENDFIGLYYSYWMGQAVEKNIKSYFLGNGKLEDKFWDVFQQIWGTE